MDSGHRKHLQRNRYITQRFLECFRQCMTFIEEHDTTAIAVSSNQTTLFSSRIFSNGEWCGCIEEVIDSA